MFWETDRQFNKGQPEKVCVQTEMLQCPFLWISEKRGDGSLTSKPKCRTPPCGSSTRQWNVPIVGDPDHKPMSKGWAPLFILGTLFTHLDTHNSAIKKLINHLPLLGNLLILPLFLEINRSIPNYTDMCSGINHSFNCNQLALSLQPPGDIWRSTYHCKSNVQFKKEVWELML